MSIPRMVLSAVLLSLLSAGGTAAIAAPVANAPIKLTSNVQVEVEVVGENGKKRIERQPANRVIPGSVVLYTNTFENVSKKSVEGIATTNPIPANTEYQAGSAYGEDTEITFSVDGGKTYAAPEKLKVKTTDGYERLAKATDFTHIRWAYKNSLAAGAIGEVGFRVVIK